MSNIRSQRSKQIMLPNRNSSLNSQMATKWYTKLKVAYKKWAIFYWSHTWNFKVTRAEKSAIRLLRFERFQTIIPVEFMDGYGIWHLYFLGAWEWFRIVFQGHVSYFKITLDNAKFTQIKQGPYACHSYQISHIYLVISVKYAKQKI